MGPEIMAVAAGHRDGEFVRLVNSFKSVDFRMKWMEQAHISQDWNELDIMLRDSIVEDEDKSSAINNAVEYGRPHLLVNNYARVKGQINISTLILLKTLHTAAKRGYHEFVSLILKECRKNEPGKLAEVINGHDDRHWTTVHWACQNGYPRVVEVILKSNVNIPLEDPPTTDASDNTTFTTPLHLAIKPLDLEEDDKTVSKSEPRCRVALVRLLLKTPEGSELLNMKDGQGNTPLHLAVETMNVAVVELLIKEPRLIATERNSKGKTPSGLVWDQTHSDLTKNSASVKIIKKYLAQLNDVQEEHQALLDARARYYNAANNLLVGGALLAQLTFAGILSMVDLPEEFLTDNCFLAPSPAPVPSVSLPPSYAQCGQSHLAQNYMEFKPYYIRAIDVFRGTNNLSFYFAIVTIMAAIRLIISRGQNIPLESEIARLRNSTILISLSLTFSTILTVMAFISGGLANIPVAESGWGYVLNHWAHGQSLAILKSTMLTTTMVGLALIIPFILIPLLLDDLAILRDYLDTKFNLWDNQHYRWVIGAWRPFLTLVLAGLFLVVTVFIMFMLVFGVGLLKDYIELPK